MTLGFLEVVYGFGVERSKIKAAIMSISAFFTLITIVNLYSP